LVLLAGCSTDEHSLGVDLGAPASDLSAVRSPADHPAGPQLTAYGGPTLTRAELYTIV